MKEVAAIIIILTTLIGITLGIFNKQIFNTEDTLRWEVLETNIQGGWTYWRDKENPELCYIENTQYIIFGTAGLGIGGLANVPCDKITTSNKTTNCNLARNHEIMMEKTPLQYYTANKYAKYVNFCINNPQCNCIEME